MCPHTHGGLETRVALVVEEPCPCTACRFVARCKAVRLACSQFSGFVAGEPESKWRKAPQVPLDSVYRMLFDGGPQVNKGGRPRGPAKPARVPDTGFREGPLVDASPTQRVAWMLARSRVRRGVQ